MSVDLSALSEGAKVVQDIGNLVLATPQSIGYRPQKESGGLGESVLFTYERENTATLESEITDHYVEDNSAIQDQISLRPEIITVNGVIGELNDALPRIDTATGFLLDQIESKLFVLGGYLPQLSVTALRARNAAFQGYQLAENAQETIDSLREYPATFGQDGITTNRNVIGSEGLEGSPENPSQTKQQVMFQKFYSYWRNRTLFTVQTPWAIFKNCAIQSLKAIQSEDTGEITDFEVSFKVMRFAETISFSFVNQPQLDGRAAEQSAEVENNGSQSGELLDFDASEIF